MTSRIFLAGLMVGTCLHAESVKDREGAVRQDKAKLESSDRWNYNDVDGAFAEAKKSGKPVMLVLRCVPCLACMGLDTGVLTEGEAMKTMLDQFVCVRLINANAIDLTKFQFDYDLSYGVIFLNADGTTYGRYGSWKHQKNSQESATEGLTKAMKAALELHRGYPANKAALAGKQPGDTPFKKPVEIPELAQRYTPALDWEGKVVASCVHCHMIGSALQSWHRQQRKPMPENLIYPFPEPETVGLTLASEEIAKVVSVAPDSIAAKAGVQVGDEISSFAGQPLVSIADVSYALHHTANVATVDCVLKRAGSEVKVTLTLPQGWRRKSQVTERATIWPERGMVLGGMRLEAAEGQGMGFKVKGVGKYGIHAAAMKAGIKEGDVVISIDGLNSPISEGELIGHLMQTREVGDKVKIVVRRGEEQKEFMLPMQ
ncbi:MAG: PDZ domain-containing protein [Verrucomicrobiaceae bacterium]|nr:PDZ domain-containing protein [Verrucomicrobiaceae bacterium]